MPQTYKVDLLKAGESSAYSRGILTSCTALSATRCIARITRYPPTHTEAVTNQSLSLCMPPKTKNLASGTGARFTQGPDAHLHAQVLNRHACCLLPPAPGGLRLSGHCSRSVERRGCSTGAVPSQRVILCVNNWTFRELFNGQRFYPQRPRYPAGGWRGQCHDGGLRSTPPLQLTTVLSVRFSRNSKCHYTI